LNQAAATMYCPITQNVKNRPSFTAVLRLSGPPATVISSARSVVRKILPEIPPPIAFTMQQTLDEALATERMMATLAPFFAGIALLITGVGLYGTLAYATQRRTKEIGIRIAIGAQRRTGVSLVCRENIAVALCGCIAGLAASVATSRLIASLLFNTSLLNPLVLSASVFVLLCIAIAASLVPAVRASRTDPITAIRYE